MSLSLSTINRNLQHCSKAKSLQELTPALWGNQVYAEGWRKKIVLFMWKLISKNRTMQNRVVRNIQRTHEAFAKHTQLIAHDLQAFRDIVDAKTQGVTPSQGQNDKYRRSLSHINEWRKWISPMLKKDLIPNIKKIEALFDSVLNQSCSPTLVDAYKMNKQSKLPLPIIEIEQKMGQDFPFEDIERISQSTYPDSLSIWVESLSKLKDAPGLLHRALLTYKKPKTTTYIEAKILENTKGALFTKEDAKQISWRDKVGKTRRIKYTDGSVKNTIELSGPIAKIQPKDNHHTYGVKGDDTKVVTLPTNPASAGLEQTLYVVADCPYPKRAQVLHIDNKGRFTVSERFGIPLEEHSWNDSDKTACKSLIQTVKYMLKNKITPQNLSPKYLLINPTTKEIRTYKIYRKDVFYFPRLEAFVHDCVDQIPSLYHYIMDKSGLRNHAHNDFLNEVITEHLKGGHKPDKLAIGHAIDDDRIISYAKTLVKEVDQTVAQCKLKRKQNGKKPLEEIREEFAKRVKSDKVCRITQNIQETIINL